MDSASNEVKWSTVKEVAEHFRVSLPVVYGWVKEGALPTGCVIQMGDTRATRLNIELIEDHFASLAVKGGGK